MLIAVLFWIFLGAIAVQCGYALYFFTRIYNLPGRKAVKPAEHPPVSVIICAHNEAANLEKYLPDILAQRYMNAGGKTGYEVIVVNDASSDDTEAVLKKMEEQYVHLRHVTIGKDEPRTFQGKKFALSRGVTTARHASLLLTDADCLPASEDWLSLMTAPLSEGKEIVSGYSGFFSAPGFLNAFTRWETMHTFLQYATYAMAGMPYMAVGRNLACTKETFLSAQASAVWNELPSGDDDLLVQLCGKKNNVGVVAHRNAFTYSAVKNTWSDWLKQKQRHLSTGKYYKPATQRLLGIYAISHALCWLLFFCTAFFSLFSFTFYFLFAARCAMYWSIWMVTSSKLRERKLWVWIPLCDIGWACYNLILSPYIFWKNKKQWK